MSSERAPLARPWASMPSTSLDKTVFRIVAATLLSTWVVSASFFALVLGISERQKLHEEIRVLSDIMAERIAISLAFGDLETSRQAVHALANNPRVQAVRVTDETGAVVLDSPGQAPVEAGMNWHTTLLQTDIRHRGQIVGQLWIRGGLRTPRTLFLAALAFSVMLFLATALISYLTKKKLSEQVVQPIAELSGFISGIEKQTASELTGVAREGGGSEIQVLIKSSHALIRALYEREAELVAERDLAHHEAARAERLLAETTQAKTALEVEARLRRKLQEEMLHKRKLEAIGRLAGGVAHDFNNQLGVIVVCASILTGHSEREIRNAGAAIMQASETAASIISQLMMFSRRQPLNIGIIELNGVVRKCASMLRRLIRSDIEFSERISETPIFVKADRTQLEQIVMNLVLNARDAVTKDKISLETGVSEGDPARGELDRALIRVKDGGIGMDAETRERAFEPFFTTKESGNGVGLGLATVHGIVEQLAGEVRIDSELGSGTCVEIKLPLASSPNTPTEAPLAFRQGPAETSATAVRVLLVEDQRSLRSILDERLQLQGHDVASVDRAEKAVELLESGQEFDVLVTDLVMPGMGGVELARRVRTDYPRIKVILITGYSQETDSIPTGTELLSKPFAIQDLLRAIALS